MVCDPEFRTRMALGTLDPATVPPDLPSPLVLDPTGLTVRETWERLAAAYERQSTGVLFDVVGVRSVVRRGC